jgi:hypothetical protein
VEDGTILILLLPLSPGKTTYEKSKYYLMPNYPFTPQDIANSGLSGAGGVDQSGEDDCVFEATMAAVATTTSGQIAIAHMIVQNPDGSYTVTFPGNAQSPITVTQSDLKNPNVNDSATWADVLEAALITWNPNFANGAQLPPNATGAADGSSPTPAQYALYLFTGNLASRDVASSVNIVAEISHVLGTGRPVVAYCANNDGGALVSGHEWTVISVTANQVTLRNPWGQYEGPHQGSPTNGITYDGNAEVTLTIEAFGQYYQEITFGNTPSLNLIFMAWKGEDTDQGIYYSELGSGNWLPQQNVAGIATSVGASVALFNGRVFMAWKGENNDRSIYFSQFSGVNWTPQQNIGNMGTSFRPSLAVYNNTLYMAWKGQDTDQGIYYSYYDGSSWVPQQNMGNVGTSEGPVLATYKGILYAIWKGQNTDQGIYFSSFNGTSWATQTNITGEGTSNGPSLAVFNGMLYAAWKGINNDQGIYYSYFNGTSWSPQKNVAGVGTSVGPTLAAYGGLLYMSWKGINNDQGLYYSSFNGNSWTSQQQIGNTGSSVGPVMCSL